MHPQTSTKIVQSFSQIIKFNHILKFFKIFQFRRKQFSFGKSAIISMTSHNESAYFKTYFPFVFQFRRKFFRQICDLRLESFRVRTSATTKWPSNMSDTSSDKKSRPFLYENIKESILKKKLFYFFPDRQYFPDRQWGFIFTNLSPFSKSLKTIDWHEIS